MKSVSILIKPNPLTHAPSGSHFQGGKSRLPAPSSQSLSSYFTLNLSPACLCLTFFPSFRASPRILLNPSADNHWLHVRWSATPLPDDGAAVLGWNDVSTPLPSCPLLLGAERLSQGRFSWIYHFISREGLSRILCYLSIYLYMRRRFRFCYVFWYYGC